MKETTGKIYIPGGLLSPGELRRIVSSLQYFGVNYIYFGNRQELLFKVNKKYVSEIPKRLGNIQYHYEIENFKCENIVSSFPAKNITKSNSWLTEDQYLEILSSFEYQPKLKINIVDPQQTLVPMFTGQLNFIASSIDNYWYLFLRLDEDKSPEMWPVLVDGNEISALSEAIEKATQIKAMSFINLQGYIYNLRTWNFKIILNDFVSPSGQFFNHEGFHEASEKYWLGIYRRGNAFPVNFIENLCILCAQTNIGLINLTPFNTVIIKNIEDKDINLWEKLLGKFGVNTGHSHLELNWQTPNLDNKAQSLKNYICKAFEKNGLRTSGLSFGIFNSQYNFSSSIQITRKPLFTLFKYDFFTSYGVKYKKGFNVNSLEVISLAEGLKRRNLPDILSYLTGIYYNNISAELNQASSTIKVEPAVEAAKAKLTPVYQCKDCLTVYDPFYGDVSQCINQGTPFEELPDNYKCSLCEADKENFVKISQEKLTVQL